MIKNNQIEINNTSHVNSECFASIKTVPSVNNMKILANPSLSSQEIEKYVKILRLLEITGLFEANGRLVTWKGTCNGVKAYFVLCCMRGLKRPSFVRELIKWGTRLPAEKALLIAARITYSGGNKGIVESRSNKMIPFDQLKGSDLWNNFIDNSKSHKLTDVIWDSLKA